MAGLKKKMKAKLDVSPMSEMDKDVIAWIEGNKILKNAFSKNYQYMEVVELDPRKWKEKEIEKDLAAIARYDLKLLDMKMGKLKSEFDKANALKQAPIIAKAKKQYEKFGKLIIDKVSLAIEEAASDKGDNKKALRDGKTAFKKIDSIDFDKIFGAFSSGAEKLLRRLEVQLEDDKPDEAKAYGAALSGFQSLLKDFDTDVKNVSAAADFLSKTSATTLKNKDAAPELHEFFGDVKKELKHFDNFDKGVADYRSSMSDIEKQLKSNTLTAGEIDGAVKTIDKFNSAYTAASKVERLLKGWIKDFDKIEKLVK